MRVAIIEDQERDAKDLERAMERYGSEQGIEVVVDTFLKPISFVDHYKEKYDVIFLDIEMPAMDGVEAAMRIRMLDESVPLIFVTNMVHRAVDGYRVQAFDFVVKPVVYERLETTMNLLAQRRQKHLSGRVPVKTEDGLYYVDEKDILYIEVRSHKLLFHLQNGNTMETWGSLNELEKRLSQEHFGRCNACYLVNLAFVKGVEKDQVVLPKILLKMSRGKKQEFLNKLMSYME